MLVTMNAQGIVPGDIVEYGTATYVVVDVADYSDEDDGGTQDVLAVLRVNAPEGARPLNPDGSDVIQDAVPVDQLARVGHIDG